MPDPTTEVTLDGPELEELGSVSAGFSVWDAVILFALVLLSMAVLGPLLLTGRTITGSDGLYAPDQLQYLAWIRQAGQHIVMGNGFDLLPDHRVFVHPGFLISGLAHRYLGFSLQVSYLAIWKPTAVLLLFFGFRAYSRRLLPDGWPTRSALIIALFAVMPWSALATALDASAQTRYTLDFISGEMWTGQTLLGYLMTGVAVGLLPIVLLGVERARGNSDRAWLVIACGFGAMAVTWLQPWQGAELLIVVGGVEVWRLWRDKVNLDLRLLWVLAAGTAPAAYYAWMGATDSTWKHYAEVNKAGAQPLWSWPLWTVVLSLAPLAIPAIAAYRGKAKSWQSVAVRIWPFAVAIAYLQPFGSFPYHAVQGLTLPLAVLAVQGFTTRRPSWAPKPRAWWVATALALLIVPGTVHKLNLARENVHSGNFQYYIAPGELKALNWLQADPRQGGVLTDGYGGSLVPPFAGRESYIGQFSLTPDYDRRVRIAGPLLAGQLSPTETQAFVAGSGATFIFQQCDRNGRPLPDLSAKLGSQLESVEVFGCSRVYVLKPTPLSSKLAPKLENPGAAATAPR